MPEAPVGKSREDADAERREIHRYIVERALEGIWVINLDDRIAYINPSMAAMLGWTASEMLGRSVFEFIRPEHHQNFRAALERARRGVSETREAEFVKQDGSPVYTRLEVSSIADVHGHYAGALAFVFDISRQKVAEQALTQSEASYRGLVEILGEGIGIVDSRECFQFGNPAAEQVFGAPPGGLVGRSLREFVDEQGYSVIQEQTSHRRQGKTDTYELAIHTAVGEKRTILITATPKFDEQGEFAGTFGIFSDITERRNMEDELAQYRDHLEDLVDERTAKLARANERLRKEIARREEAEAALREGEARYRELADSISDIFFAVDRDLRLTYWNKSSESFSGISAEQAVGKPFRGLFPQPAGSEIEQLCLSTLSDQTSRSLIVPFTTGDREVIFEGMAYPSARGISVFLRDITGRRRSEELLLQASRLEATYTLSAGLAHDLNNLMTIVLNSAELLKMECDSARLQGWLQDIIGAAHRTADLTRQLLAYARGGKYQTEALNLNALIQRNLGPRPGAIPSRIRLNLDLAAGLWLVEADPVQMNQVLTNLCLNAVEAIANEGTITIRTGNLVIPSSCEPALSDLPSGRYVRLCIEDSGCGMAADTLSKVFEPFFTTKFHGRGLGLPAVYGIVKNHGGHVRVESRKTEGTGVTVCLPAAPSEACPKEVRNGLPTPATILVVDDEEMVLKTVAQILEHLGFSVLPTLSGSEAVRLVGSYPDRIDAVLLDLEMPDIPGGEVFDQIRRIRPGLKVIIYSGYEQDSRAEGLLKRGAVGFLQKPCSTQMLAQTIQDALSASPGTYWR
jgi:PAS domain S-box-containing protein